MEPGSSDQQTAAPLGILTKSTICWKFSVSTHFSAKPLNPTITECKESSKGREWDDGSLTTESGK